MILSEEMENTLKKAYREAQDRRNEYVTLEHLLLALTYDSVASDVIQSCGGDIEELRRDLTDFLDKELEPLPEDLGSIDPSYTIGVQHVLQLAAFHTQSTKNKEMDGGYVLAAIFREENSFAVYYLSKQEITRLDVVRYISHGIRKEKQPSGDFQEERESKDSGDPLSDFCINLNERAQKGKIDPLVGRENELERTIQVLARRRKNNPVFVGDAGVGKTAIVEGLAKSIVSGDVPDSLKNMTVYSLDMGLLLAGTKFRGEFEERLKGVVQSVSGDPNKVIFIDEIHTIVGAGAVSGGSLDASNLLKPALANGDLRCIGTTTFKEYKSIFEKDHALARRFQKIEVAEPSIDESIQILKGLQKKYEDFHGVQYSENAIKTAVELSAKHILDRHLPDKAIDLMDEAGARVKLKNESKQVTVRTIEDLVARIAKVPARTVKTDDREKLKNLEGELRSKIFGQDKAVEQVVQSIQLSRSGLSEEGKPVGSFLFAGPTGVGKTELAKQIAESLGVEFIRFDMSEYMEKHTVSRLIGSPPGYVGFEQGGQLTDAINRTPYCVLLLDEIEKAHEDIYNILLQVMDHATLTDNNGRKADFKQVILIMTTNTGARERQMPLVGFEGDSNQDDRSQRAIERVFSPEFRNRLTAIIQFDALSGSIVEKVVQKQIDLLEQKLYTKKVHLEIEEGVLSFIAKEAYDENFGARPVQRWIDSHIAKKLSGELLFGKLKSGGTVRISVLEDSLSFAFEEK